MLLDGRGGATFARILDGCKRLLGRLRALARLPVLLLVDLGTNNLRSGDISVGEEVDRHDHRLLVCPRPGGHWRDDTLQRTGHVLTRLGGFGVEVMSKMAGDSIGCIVRGQINNSDRE